MSLAHHSGLAIVSLAVFFNSCVVGNVTNGVVFVVFCVATVSGGVKYLSPGTSISSVWAVTVPGFNSTCTGSFAPKGLCKSYLFNNSSGTFGKRSTALPVSCSLEPGGATRYPFLPLATYSSYNFFCSSKVRDLLVIGKSKPFGLRSLRVFHSSLSRETRSCKSELIGGASVTGVADAVGATGFKYLRPGTSTSSATSVIGIFLAQDDE